MLKIGKGLKKKKKSKKHKKDEELFTQEELEQYKREHQQRSIAAAEHIEGSGSAGGYEDSEEHNTTHQQHNTTETTKAQDQDEWKKFNELTTGIDSILHKTKDDLDRIKQTSFFKRTPPPKPAPPSKPADPEENSSTQDKKNWADFKQEQQQQQFKSEVAATSVALLEESGSEYETDEDDNIFDTSYVDVVASGEIKLAYIPDDDDQNNDTDDIDPFDTSAADKIIRGPEVSKKGKKLVSIGSAVEVLTGRVDPSCLVTARSPSVRRKHQIDDLLIVDEPQEQPQTDSNGNNVTSIAAPKSLLDDDIDDIIIAEHTITLATATTTSNQQQQKQETKPVLDLNEFDVLATIQNTGDELDDEFTSLAAESLKTTVPIILDAKQIQIEPKVEINTHEWNAFDSDQTTITTTDQLKVLQKDLLGSSTTDLSQLHDTITPITANDDNDNDDIDPFDTSSIEKINIPGKVELKFIEAELLGDKQQPKQSTLPSDDFDDDDFNPRQDEQHKQQIITTDDIFEKTDDNDLSVLQSIETLQTPALKPIPALSTDNNQLDEISEDPFDTSFIATVVPGKAELKLIENELATIQEAKNNAVTIKLNKLLEERQLQQQQEEQIKEEKVEITDLLVVDNDNDDIINTKVLTPVNPHDQIDDQLTYVDPFDTTNNTFNILPGKAELKLLENELLTIQETTETVATTNSRQEKLNDLLTSLDDADDQHFIHNLQPLTPAATTSGEQQQQQPEQDEDFDPFDTTSITTNLVPGAVELKLIESELIQQ